MEDVKKIEEFSGKFIVSSTLVTSFIKDTLFSNVKKKLAAIERQKLRASEPLKSYDDYDWDNLIANGKLGDLTHNILNKYLIIIPLIIF